MNGDGDDTVFSDAMSDVVPLKHEPKAALGTNKMPVKDSSLAHRRHAATEFPEIDRNQLTSVNGLEKLTKLTMLHLSNNYLTNVKGLEKLTQSKSLHLSNNPDLTKAQIDELKKALPKAWKITSNPKK